MTYIYKEIEIDLSDFEDDDLIEELSRRNGGRESLHEIGILDKMRESIDKIHQLRRNGRDYERELDDLIYISLGRIA